ncbi:hypothetical protein H8356DRAFT_1044525 [Neocallimastix lanati (nom. inval.)]|nr:hypothetical protein H8356DRAFT_1044525 [Neocallimastix sp. JGI-2020a]
MTSPSFDPSLIEIFVSIVLGGTLIIPSFALVKATNYLFQYCFNNTYLTSLIIKEWKNSEIKINEINIELMLMMTPSHLFNFERARIKDILTGKTNIKNVVLGGEKFPSLNTLLEIMKGEKRGNDYDEYPNTKLGISLWNIYGTTENSVWASLYQVGVKDFNYFISKRKEWDRLQKNRKVNHSNNNIRNDKDFDQDFDLFSIDNIPLGSPLLKTTLLLRYLDEDGLEKYIEFQDHHHYYRDNTFFPVRRIKDSFSSSNIKNTKNWILGELWIGGDRQNWIDLDEKNRYGQYIKTGDLVLFNRISCTLYHYGRSNQQIKISGYRINLEQCNSTIEKITKIKKCVTLSLNNSLKDEIVSFIIYNEEFLTNEKVIINNIKEKLKNLLPFYAIPNQILMLKEFPLNKNGKIDQNQLQNLYLEKIAKEKAGRPYNSLNLALLDKCHKSVALTQIMGRIFQLLMEIDPKYNDILKKLSESPLGNEMKKVFFFEIGGHSFQANLLAEKLCKLIINDDNNDNINDDNDDDDVDVYGRYHDSKRELWKDQIKELSLYIMNYSFYDIANKVYEIIKNKKGLSHRNSNEKKNQDSKNDPSTKDKKRNTVMSSFNSESRKGNGKRLKFKFIGFLNKSQYMINGRNISYDTMMKEDDSLFDFASVHDNPIKFDFKKCVDASPTIAITKTYSHDDDYKKLEYTCFIGSHSSLFMSINILENKINWKVSLNDRIEGCACLSLDGTSVMVGCYDGYLYCLSVKNGEIFWKFKTGDLVKCTPVVDVVRETVWFGSYDQWLYELDIKNKRLIGKFKTGGAILGSPVIDSEKRIVYCCNLKGEVYSIPMNNNPPHYENNQRNNYYHNHHHQENNNNNNEENNEIKNSNTDNDDNDNNNVHNSNNENNFDNNKNSVIYIQNWKFVVEDQKPIFTTPRLTKDGSRLYFGCVDGFLYCLNTLTSELIWKFNTEGPIFSTPCLFNHDQNIIIGNHSNYIICVNISIQNEEGQQQFQYKYNNNNTSSKYKFSHEEKEKEKEKEEKKKERERIKEGEEDLVLKKDYEWKIKTEFPIFSSPFFSSSYSSSSSTTTTTSTLHNTKEKNDRKLENWLYVIDIDGNLFKIKLNIELGERREEEEYERKIKEKEKEEEMKVKIEKVKESEEKEMEIEIEKGKKFKRRLLSPSVSFHNNEVQEDMRESQQDNALITTPCKKNTANNNNKRIKISTENEFQMVHHPHHHTSIISLDKIKLSGPIFSSPIVINNQFIIVGSRDNHLYILQ